MYRFSLRTLIVVMLLGGPVVAEAWWAVDLAMGGNRQPLALMVSLLALATLIGWDCFSR